MRHPTRPLALGLAALLLAACTDAGSPVMPEPTPDPGPETTRLQLDFLNIEVIKDCDGIEGDGDFNFRVVASPSFGSATTVYNRSVTMGDGDRTAAIGRRTFTASATNGQQVTVQLVASERDKPVIGAARDDSRMSNASGTRSHRYNGSQWSALGPQSITLGPSDCRVRLNYTATALD